MRYPNVTFSYLRQHDKTHTICRNSHQLGLGYANPADRGGVSENINKPRRAVYIGHRFLYVVDVYAYFRSVLPKTMNAVRYYLLVSSLFLY